VDPENKELIGGYRFYFPEKVARIAILPSLLHQHIFISLKNSLPILSSSDGTRQVFCTPDYQSRSMGRKSLFALITFGMGWEQL